MYTSTQFRFAIQFHSPVPNHANPQRTNHPLLLTLNVASCALPQGSKCGSDRHRLPHRTVRVARTQAVAPTDRPTACAVAHTPRALAGMLSRRASVCAFGSFVFRELVPWLVPQTDMNEMPILLWRRRHRHGHRTCILYDMGTASFFVQSNLNTSLRNGPSGLPTACAQPSPATSSLKKSHI